MPLAKEWRRAEEDVERLEKDLKEKEMALRWQHNQKERIAQLMAKDEELERVEQKKYEEFRRKLDDKHEEEEKV